MQNIIRTSRVYRTSQTGQEAYARVGEALQEGQEVEEKASAVVKI